VKINNKEFYAKSIKQHGVSPLGVHWKNQDTQYKRFEILTDFIKHDITNSSIVDAGCGFGEYYKYLKEHNLLPKRYLGIDREASMVEKAKDRFDTNFLVLNILKEPLPKADYYLSSGALNILSIKEVDIFIENIYKASEKGVVFNFLKGSTFNGISQVEVMEIAQQYAQELYLKEGYLENDFTLFLR